MRAILSSLLLAAVSAHIAFAPAGRAAEADGKTTPASDDSSGHTAQGLRVEPATVDFGTFREGQLRRRSLTLRNTNEVPFTVARAYSPCPCMTLRLEQTEIPAGGAVTAEIVVHSLGLQGAQTWPLHFQCKGPSEVLLTATAKTSIERAPAQLAIHPDAIQLGTVRADGTAEASVYLFNLTKDPVDVSDLSASSESIHAEWVGETRIPGGLHVKIEVRCDRGTFEPGPIRDAITFRTSLPLHHAVRLPLRGTVLAAPEKTGAQEE